MCLQLMISHVGRGRANMAIVKAIPTIARPTIAGTLNRYSFFFCSSLVPFRSKTDKNIPKIKPPRWPQESIAVPGKRKPLIKEKKTMNPKKSKYWKR